MARPTWSPWKRGSPLPGGAGGGRPPAGRARGPPGLLPRDLGLPAFRVVRGGPIQSDCRGLEDGLVRARVGDRGDIGGRRLDSEEGPGGPERPRSHGPVHPTVPPVGLDILPVVAG